jgi:hypothetical protein
VIPAIGKLTSAFGVPFFVFIFCSLELGPFIEDYVLGWPSR